MIARMAEELVAKKTALLALSPGDFWSSLPVEIFEPRLKDSPPHRVGIVRDIIVTPTITGIGEGRHEVLEEALRQILGSVVDQEMIRRMARQP